MESKPKYSLNAVKKSKELLECNPLFLDTETTGLDDKAEIVEISILDVAGNIVFHSLVKPINPIPEGAMAIHGITNDEVENAPRFTEIIDDLLSVMTGRKTLIYNEDYDVRLMLQSAHIAGAKKEKSKALFDLLIEQGSTDCIMLLYAMFDGEQSHRGGYKWHKLVTAAEYFGVDTSEAHRATADCLMTIKVLKGMASANDN